MNSSAGKFQVRLLIIIQAFVSSCVWFYLVCRQILIALNNSQLPNSFLHYGAQKPVYLEFEGADVSNVSTRHWILVFIEQDIDVEKRFVT